eukprot:13034958-Heterocapsa_arctica.AAC.1
MRAREEVQHSQPRSLAWRGRRTERHRCRPRRRRRRPRRLRRRSRRCSSRPGRISHWPPRPQPAALKPPRLRPRRRPRPRRPLAGSDRAGYAVALPCR